MAKRRHFKPIQYAVGSPIYTAETHRDPRRRTFKQINWGVPTSLAPVYASWRRIWTLKEILTSDTSVSGYTQPWEWTNSFSNSSIFLERFHYGYRLGNPPDTTGAQSRDDRWVRKMRPVRIKLGVFSLNNTMSNALPLYVMSGSGWNGGQNIGNAAVGPFESGHTNGGRAIMITGCCPIISRIDPTLSQNHNIRITHYRLWIDGVDVTGVVPTNQKFTTPLRQLQRNLGFVATLNMTCPETVATEAEVEADVWVELDVQRGTFNSALHSSGGYVPGLLLPAGGGAADLETSLQIFPFGYWSRGQRINTGQVVDQRWFFDGVFEQGINVNARRGRNEVYTLEFDRAGPAGVSSLVMQPQTNWDFTNPFPGVIRLQKTTGTGALDFVFMNWQREVPLITVSKRGVTPNYTSDPDEILRYSPEPNSTFTRWDSSVTDGTWPVATATVFRAVGRGIGNAAQDLGDVWQSQSYFSRALNVSDAFAGFPLTITVTR